jgi:hypothetical protein
MTHPPTPNPLAGRSLRAPISWGVVFGVIQAASPLGLWWLDPATVYALSLTLIAAVYIGLAVADGRPTVIAVEAAVAAVFVVVAAAGVTGPAWLLVAGLAGHGFKDLWQHRSRYVANTGWWPPFCLVVDWVVAAILVVLLAAGPTSTRPTMPGPVAAGPGRRLAAADKAGAARTRPPRR